MHPLVRLWMPPACSHGSRRPGRRSGGPPRRNPPRAGRAREMPRDVTDRRSRSAEYSAADRRGRAPRHGSRGRERVRPHLSHAPRRKDRDTEDSAQDPRRPFDGLYAWRRPVCVAIAQGSEKGFNLTIKKNTVAVVTDGTAVLGLGDIGPAAAMPVMEGKCRCSSRSSAASMRFRSVSIPRTSHEIVETVHSCRSDVRRYQSRGYFGPALLRDRGPPERGSSIFPSSTTTSTVRRSWLLAALINALKVVGKKIEDSRSRQRHRCRGRRGAES